jgi:DNA adenine methylase
VPHLEPHWTPERHRRLVEPFCGGLAVTLTLRPTRALLNDVNPHLINFYRWVKRGLRARRPMENDEAAFYAARDRFNALLAGGGADTAEAAELFYYLNRTAFNGLCRFNASGQFNVPFGRHASIGYQRSFPEHEATFASWELACGDFEALALEDGDFVYADPPYDVPFTQYSKGGFSWEDQQRTARWLAGHAGPVILVNQATDRIVKLYRELGYRLDFHDAPRRISCTGDRTPAREVLATRNLP